MRRYRLLLLAVFLAAGAMLLPGQLSQWGDLVLLDEPHIIREAEREGFAESVQLTVGEKLILIGSGSLDRLSLVAEDQPSGLYINSAAVEVVEFNLEETDGVREKVLTEQWGARLAAAQTEVRTLQALGGLPALWSADSDVEFLDCDQTIYIDRNTQMSFQVYSLVFRCAPYSLDVTVDQQSGRILSFNLIWDRSEELNWGLRGASGFGTAWRDYWGLDSVSGGWYNEYNRSILEDAVKDVRKNGDYNANSQIPFTYNDHSLNVSLVNWCSAARGYSLLWNQT